MFKLAALILTQAILAEAGGKQPKSPVIYNRDLKKKTGKSTSPTTSPSNSPTTPAPTPAPSSKPSVAASDAPSKEPSKEPSAEPTACNFEGGCALDCLDFAFDPVPTQGCCPLGEVCVPDTADQCAIGRGTCVQGDIICLSNDGEDWVVHANRAIDNSGSLMTINDATTDAWVQDAIDDYTGSGSLSNQDYWFGLLDNIPNGSGGNGGDPSSERRNVVWLAGDTRVTYIRPGAGFSTSFETCIEWETFTRDWRDDPCNNNNAALYQFPGSSLNAACGLGNGSLSNRCFSRAVVETGTYSIDDELCADLGRRT
eukprot:CAMPEP_0172439134 /NCGR_PEP_ID=MMETSP1065-20121228/212_1 /TAXON_ID=265537 /ORGANISM="Amphiprora paludosa, Strain CCMP125" /LENGTH=311 /DNA_ID=CAMNT_0013187771 /DNA_START=83 /DNA_END=1018 /DNA_ORIENTATION=+